MSKTNDNTSQSFFKIFFEVKQQIFLLFHGQLPFIPHGRTGGRVETVPFASGTEMASYNRVCNHVTGIENFNLELVSPSSMAHLSVVNSSCVPEITYIQVLDLGKYMSKVIYQSLHTGQNLRC